MAGRRYNRGLDAASRTVPGKKAAITASGAAVLARNMAAVPGDRYKIAQKNARLRREYHNYTLWRRFGIEVPQTVRKVETKFKDPIKFYGKPGGSRLSYKKLRGQTSAYFSQRYDRFSGAKWGKVVNGDSKALEEYGKFTRGLGKAAKVGKSMVASPVGKALGVAGFVFDAYDVGSSLKQGIKAASKGLNGGAYFRKAGVKVGSAIVGAAVGSLLGPGGTLLGAKVGSMAGDGINWVIDHRKAIGKFFSRIGKDFANGSALRRAGRTVLMHAAGGIVSGGAQLHMVAEEGHPEMIIPLAAQRRKRGLELWAQTGRIMGVEGLAKGEIHADPFAGSISHVFQSSVSSKGGSKESQNIMEIVRTNMEEIAEGVAGVLNTVISGQYANTPV